MVLTLMTIVFMFVLLQYTMMKNISRRQREIALFSILGAYPREIIGGFLYEISLIVIGGLLLGGGLAVWASAFYVEVITLTSLPFEFNYLDPADISYPRLLALAVSIVTIGISILSAFIAIKMGVRKPMLIALNNER